MEDYREIIKEWRQRPNENYGGYHLADRPAQIRSSLRRVRGPRLENIGAVSGFPFACPRK